MAMVIIVQWVCSVSR